MTLANEPVVALLGTQPGIDYFLDCPTGTVEHYFSDGLFHWSDELYRIHGYERGEIVPTLDLGLAHIEPEDRAAVQGFWDTVLSRGGPVSVYVRLRDLQGRQRQVLLSADLILENATAVGVWGIVVDLTKSIHADRHQLAHEAVAASALSRAVIEQAKGILMGRAGLNAAEAFERIKGESQKRNRKVVVIAQEIIDHALQPRSVSEDPKETLTENPRR